MKPDQMKISAEKAKRERIADTLAASERLNVATARAAARTPAASLCYLRGFLESHAKSQERITPAEVLNILACYIERENARSPRPSPSAPCNVSEYLDIAAGGHRKPCSNCGGSHPVGCCAQDGNGG